MSTRCFFNSLFRDAGHRGYSYILSIILKAEIDEFSIECFEKVSPYMGGIGISSAVVSFNVALYYNTIIAWCLFYFVQVKKVYN